METGISHMKATPTVCKAHYSVQGGRETSPVVMVATFNFNVKW